MQTKTNFSAPFIGVHTALWGRSAPLMAEADGQGSDLGITDASNGPGWEVGGQGFIGEDMQAELGFDDPLNKKPSGLEAMVLGDQGEGEEGEGEGNEKEGEDGDSDGAAADGADGDDEQGVNTAEDDGSEADDDAADADEDGQGDDTDPTDAEREVKGLRREISKLRNRAQRAEELVRQAASQSARAVDAYDKELPKLNKELRETMSARNKAMMDDDLDAATDADVKISELNRKISRIENAKEQVEVKTEDANAEMDSVMVQAAQAVMAEYPFLNSNNADVYDESLVTMVNAVFEKNLTKMGRLDAFTSAVEMVLEKTGKAKPAKAAQDKAKKDKEDKDKQARDKRRDAARNTPASRNRSASGGGPKEKLGAFNPNDVYSKKGQAALTKELGIRFAK